MLREELALFSKFLTDPSGIKATLICRRNSVLADLQLSATPATATGLQQSKSQPVVQPID
jgi:hypothetical protein